MKYEFEVYQMEVEEHLFWVAKSKVLKGCVGQGETVDDAIKELESNELEWLETAKEFDIPIPPISIRSDSSFSGKVSLRFSPFMHEEASWNAKEQGISLNQYINDAIVYYNGIQKAFRNMDCKPNPGNNGTESDETIIIDFPAYRQIPESFNIQFSEELEEL